MQFRVRIVGPLAAHKDGLIANLQTQGYTPSSSAYLHADVTLKEKALARVAPLSQATTRRYQPGDHLMAFLNAL